MNRVSPHGPDRLPATHVMVTGVTGFVGQAVLERLLSDHPDVRVSVLIRAGDGMSGTDRLRTLIDRPVFDVLRGRIGAPALHHRAAAMTVIEADLTEAYDVPQDVDAVLHCASSVKFDERIDYAFATNVGGAQALYAGLTRAGVEAHVVHVSTAYVSAGRAARAEERSLEHTVEWRTEMARARRFGADQMSTLEAAPSLARAAKQAHAAVVARLTRLGARRAAELGWTDVYTMTKALGERVAEQMWAAAGQRLTVLRPTIIESALRRPFPGWMDGFKVADPVIAAYAKGALQRFPGHPDNVLDLIPVDLVVDAAFLALRNPPQPGRARFVHVASGSRNPLTLQDMLEHTKDFFTRQPWTGAHQIPVTPPDLEFTNPTMMRRAATVSLGALRVLKPLTVMTDRLTGAAFEQRRARSRRRLSMFREYLSLYGPYTCSSTVFETTVWPALVASASLVNASAGSAHADANPTKGSDITDVCDIDWGHYLQQVHLPALVTQMKRHQRGTARSAPVDVVDVAAIVAPVSAAAAAQRIAMRTAVGAAVAPGTRPGDHQGSPD